MPYNYISHKKISHSWKNKILGIKNLKFSVAAQDNISPFSTQSFFINSSKPNTPIPKVTAFSILLPLSLSISVCLVISFSLIFIGSLFTCQLGFIIDLLSNLISVSSSLVLVTHRLRKNLCHQLSMCMKFEAQSFNILFSYCYFSSLDCI